jgi:RsmE family RNA methyltransferase
MNMVLFEPDENSSFLPFSDPRAAHISRILKLKTGDSFKAGIINSLSGTAEITDLNKEGLYLNCTFTESSPPLYPVEIIIGAVRPIVLKRILKDLSSMGVKKITVCGTELGEKSYLESSLLQDGCREYLAEGASQACTSLIPELYLCRTLKQALGSLDGKAELAAFDNIRPSKTVSEFKTSKSSTVIAVGSERGWSEKERELMEDAGFILYGLGKRVLRTETGTILACGIILSRMGFF